MPYLKVQLCISSALNEQGKPVDMPELNTMYTEIVTTGATSATSTLVVDDKVDPRKARWILTPVGGNMYVQAAAAPTAADTGADTPFNGDWLQNGQTRSYNVRVNGEKIAVIDSTL